MAFGDEIHPSFWCPSSTNEQFQFDTDSNKWPWYKIKGNARKAYNANPIAALEPDMYLFETDANGIQQMVPNGSKYKSMPFLASIDSNESIMSDWITKTFSVDQIHEDGVNATYFDGSAKFFKNMNPWLANFQLTHSTSQNSDFQKIWDMFKENR